MNPKGRVLLVGADAALAAAITPSMVGREFDLAQARDARVAIIKLATESFSAVVYDAARISAAERDALLALHKERGGFALFGLEPQLQLSPAVQAPLRRLPWPLPKGFLDQVRAAEIPIMFLVESTLFVTQGLQTALRQSGINCIPMESVMGSAELLAEQVRKFEEHRTKTSPPKKTGFWGRLSGEPEPQESTGILGKILVVRFTGTAAEAAQADARLRQTLHNAVCYAVSSVDPLREAAAAVKAGAPASLPRDAAGRVAELLTGGLDTARSGPREKERILLVDNETSSLSRLSEPLLSLGYEIVTSNNGEEALAMALTKPFHLAAIGGSALETTKMSGAKLALKLRDKDKDLCIVLMVDQFPVQDALKGVSRAVELGLDDAILKPIDTARLVLSIQRALEKRFLRADRERLLKEVQESERKLAQVNGFQTKFFATVAHDVKNPLTAILGYSEVLGMRLKERPDELKCAAHIHNAAKTLNLLVSDLVDLAAIESGKLRVEIGPMDLSQVIVDVKSRVDVVAQRKQLRFSTTVPPLPPMQGDPNRIGQVIQNLCTNAVQYTKEGGRVTIEARVQPGWVIVGVRDTGIGISKEDLPRIWERFFQTKEAQTMRKAGFGLGLKIAREIVQMHGGDMGIESELGVGSIFYFKLPIPKGAPAPMSFASTAIPSVSSSPFAAAPAAPAPPIGTGIPPARPAPPPVPRPPSPPAKA